MSGGETERRWSEGGRREETEGGQKVKEMEGCRGREGETKARQVHKTAAYTPLVFFFLIPISYSIEFLIELLKGKPVFLTWIPWTVFPSFLCPANSSLATPMLISIPLQCITSCQTLC